MGLGTLFQHPVREYKGLLGRIPGKSEYDSLGWKSWSPTEGPKPHRPRGELGAVKHCASRVGGRAKRIWVLFWAPYICIYIYICMYKAPYCRAIPQIGGQNLESLHMERCRIWCRTRPRGAAMMAKRSPAGPVDARS